MKKLCTIAGVLALGLVSACSDSSNTGLDLGDPPADPPPRATLQVVHASSNAPAVNITADGAVTFAAVDYKESPIPITLAAGTTLDVGVDAILPDGTTATVLELPGQMFEGDTIYTVFAVGNVGDEGDTALQAVAVTRSEFFVPSDTIRATALHAAAGAPEVDIYLAEAGLPIDQLSPINAAPVAFGDSLGPLDIAEGTYQIRVTLAGDADAIVFDSGPLDLPGGIDPIVAAVDNTNAGSESPVSVLLVDRLGVTEVQDIMTEAAVRVTHAVPDVGEPVDVLVDDVIVVPDFDFTNVAGPLWLDAGSYVFQVALNGMVVINPPTQDEDGNDVPPASTTLVDGVYYDAIAVGSVVAENLGLLVASDDRRRVATAAKLRVIHASPSTEGVDLYIVDQAIVDITNEDPFAAEVPYLFNSGYLEVTPGIYNIYITPTGTKDIAIAVEGAELDAAGRYTAIARDPIAPDTALGLILLDDAAPAP